MSYFLGTVTVQDGEHEHTHYCLVKAKSQELAQAKLEASCHDLGEDEDQETAWGYGDGLTTSEALSVQPLTDAEAVRLQDLNIAHDLA